ncbi:MAG TPA: ATP-binding protein [Candidatus Acidoferrales bacterium]|nr:ATP-binding protein [Candidatus Acidoferrales bacterium]
MNDEFDIRCDPNDLAGLLAEIKRRDKIIAALMNRVQSDMNSSQTDFSLLQSTFVLEEEVRRRTGELQRALDALTAAKREAEGARQLLFEAISAIPEGITLCDPDDKLVFCNQAAMALWELADLKLPEIMGRSFAELLDEAARRMGPEDRRWLARCLEEHKLANGTNQERLPDGRIVQIRERKTPDGYTVGICSDITQLTELQAAEAARRQLLDLIDFLPDGTFAIDEQGKVIAWNRAMEDITGIAKEYIVGQGGYAYAKAIYGERRPTLLDVLHQDNPDVTVRYENYYRKGSIVRGEVFLKAAFGGRGAHCDVIAAPLLNREGKQVGAIECLRDITDRKRAEADLHGLQEQLHQAAKMEAVGRLAGGIAHDFNNQLTIVQSYCKLLLAHLPSDSSDSKRQIGEIFRAAERSAQLTRQLLAFGRKQTLHPEVLALKDVLPLLSDPLARIIGEQVRMKMDVGDDLWNVKVDRNQLEQAIINLAVNARDAMPGGGTLSIEVHNVVLDPEDALRHLGAHENDYVCLSIRDTGTGIDEASRARIFEPFFTTKPMGVGTGLGLSLVYGFVKQSGGWVDVTSKVGQGSCFSLYFPKATDTVASSSIVAPKDPSPEAGTETILVIEDQEALRELTSHILESGGYHVLQAEDGYAALEISRNCDRNIDLVLSDVVMPGMSGPEVVKELRRRRPELKAILVTGHAEESVVGASDLNAQIMTKPFTPESLFRTVRQVLDLMMDSSRKGAT